VTTPAHPGRMLFVTLPVADVARSRAFFTALGFPFDDAFSGEEAACMMIGEQASVMLGSHETFAQHSKLPMADPTTHALALYSFSVPTREDVDRLVDTALAAGAVEADPLEDLGFMVSRSFFDLDGHGWQVMWMAPAAAQPDAEPAAQAAGV
jgi:predicted lactoylglutathione lyase